MDSKGKQAAYQRKHYAKNPEYYKRKSRERKARLRTFFREQKRWPCTDCGEKYPPCVMDFDHTGDDKVVSPGRMVTLGWGESKMLKELDKCELVCANCHRIRTSQRAGWEI